jgi:hypothetical protein
MKYKDYKLILFISCYMVVFGVSALAAFLGILGAGGPFGGGLLSFPNIVPFGFIMTSGFLLPGVFGSIAACKMSKHNRN